MAAPSARVPIHSHTDTAIRCGIAESEPATRSLAPESLEVAKSPPARPNPTSYTRDPYESRPGRRAMPPAPHLLLRRPPRRASSSSSSTRRHHCFATYHRSTARALAAGGSGWGRKRAGGRGCRGGAAAVAQARPRAVGWWRARAGAALRVVRSQPYVVGVGGICIRSAVELARICHPRP